MLLWLLHMKQSSRWKLYVLNRLILPRSFPHAHTSRFLKCVGDPGHHELPSKQSKIREVWGFPKKNMHYEPRVRLQLASLAALHNITVHSKSGALSSDDSRSKMEQYYDRMKATEDAKLLPAHEDVIASMKATEAFMSADDARVSEEFFTILDCNPA